MSLDEARKLGIQDFARSTLQNNGWSFATAWPAHDSTPGTCVIDIQPNGDFFTVNAVRLADQSDRDTYINRYYCNIYRNFGSVRCVSDWGVRNDVRFIQVVTISFSISTYIHKQIQLRQNRE